MANEVKRIEFEGGELLGVRTEDGKVYLGIKKACLDIGLSEDQAKAETKKIQKNVLYESNWVKFDTVQVEGGREVNRKVIGLEEKFVPMWLAQINLTPNMRKINPQAVEKLLVYQLKASDALHEAFMATEEQKQELYDELGLKGEIVELKEEIVSLKFSFDKLTQYVTINSREAQKILHATKGRVNYLLGGAQSERYKKESRRYFKNLWNDFAERFGVATYKDLSPSQVEDGYQFIKSWNFV